MQGWVIPLACWVAVGLLFDWQVEIHNKKVGRKPTAMEKFFILTQCLIIWPVFFLMTIYNIILLARKGNK